MMTTMAEKNEKQLSQMLREIERLDPYWQKVEWIKLRQDDPELWQQLLDFSRDKGGK